MHTARGSNFKEDDGALPLYYSMVYLIEAGGGASPPQVDLTSGVVSLDFWDINSGVVSLDFWDITSGVVSLDFWDITSGVVSLDFWNATSGDNILTIVRYRVIFLLL